MSNPPRPSSLSLLSCLVTVTLYASVSSASPWLLPPDTLVLSGRYDYASASEEFLADEGTLQRYPLEGRYLANTYTLGARFGLSERFELEMSLPLKVVSFRSDPVILLTPPEGGDSFNFYQENIISFNQSSVGLGDLNLAARFSLSAYPIASSIELAVSAPTGYQAPAGTFGAKPSSSDDFVAQAQELARPENIRDDVTLGDGVFSFTPTFHAGFGSSFGLFVRGSAGVRIRNGGAGDQLITEAKTGYFITQWMLVYGGVYSELALSRGRVIGLSIAADDPSLPAEEYEGLENLKPIPVTLDRDLIATPIGVLFKPLKAVDMTLTYSPIVSGRNVAKAHTVSVGVNVVSSY